MPREKPKPKRMPPPCAAGCGFRLFSSSGFCWNRDHRRWLKSQELKQQTFLAKDAA
jgi:hypothetical protein